MNLSDSVGSGGNNAAADVEKVKRCLVQFGYDISNTATPAEWGTCDAELIKAIKLFQAIIGDEENLSHRSIEGLVKPNSRTLDWLNADNAPRWLEMEDGSNTGEPAELEQWYNYEKLEGDEEAYWCTDWLQDVIKHSSTIYRGNHPTGQPIYIQKATRAGGGLGPTKYVERGGNRVPHHSQLGYTQFLDDTLAVADKRTIATTGCAVTSVSMTLAYYGRLDGGSAVDPGTLDTYLDNNNGYSGTYKNAIIWSVPVSGTSHGHGWATGMPILECNNFVTGNPLMKQTLNARIDDDRPTLARIAYANSNRQYNHFVVIVGRDELGRFIMNDPGSSSGDGATANQTDANIVEATTRQTGYEIVGLVLYDEEDADELDTSSTLNQTGMSISIMTPTNKSHDIANHNIYDSQTDPVETHGKKHKKWDDWTLHADYDQEGARVFLKSLKMYGVDHKKIFFNDSVLISEKLCKPRKGNHDHIHFTIDVPDQWQIMDYGISAAEEMMA